MQEQPMIFFDRTKAKGSTVFEDRFGRSLTYLRISVTDRCNMRCDYCRPSADAYKAEPRSHILSFEEIERIVRVAADLGVSKIRITGGEPLVRKDVVQLVASLAKVKGICDISMTSNANLLTKYAADLVQAGLQRINISLDSLNSLRFQRLTGAELEPVLAGIVAAKEAGLRPLKINVVLMRGINDGEVADLIDFAVQHEATIRFIELMPMKQGMDWEKHYISIDTILQRNDVRQRVNVDATLHTRNTAARYLPLKKSKGEVGFIMPMSQRFCEGCNRLRLTSDGGLRSCLPADEQLNLRDLMRRGGSDDDIRQVFLRSALIKPEIGVYDFSADSEKRSMIHVGG